MNSPAAPLCLTLSYDGTDFHGWQVQPELRTVQGVLERTLETILTEPIRVTGAGRTDRGVHALGQVASFTTTRAIPLEGLWRALEALLPPDVRVQAVARAAPGFNARYAARSRVYLYRLRHRQSPFHHRYAWSLRDLPPAAELNAASRAVVGRHAFDSFTAGEGLSGSTVCTVLAGEWQESEDELTFRIEADRFLFRMVRTLVGTLIGLGRTGELSRRSLEGILEARRHTRLAVPAPPNGLYLESVTYSPADLVTPGVTR